MASTALLPPQRPVAMSAGSLRNRQHRHGNENVHLPTNFASSAPAFRSAGATPRHTAEPLSGDRRQAEYYIALLQLNLRRIDHRIDKCRAAITYSQAAGDIDNVIGFRDLLRLEHEERRAVEILIANLQRRFPPASTGSTP